MRHLPQQNGRRAMSREWDQLDACGLGALPVAAPGFRFVFRTGGRFRPRLTASRLPPGIAAPGAPGRIERECRFGYSKGCSPRVPL
ncbi:MAG: hypothetical protein MZU84_01895 [Sphingobacterium sp.]|nr:hypothetical protein [Sphingobacterium sp.]